MSDGNIDDLLHTILESDASDEREVLLRDLSRHLMRHGYGRGEEEYGHEDARADYVRAIGWFQKEVDALRGRFWSAMPTMEELLELVMGGPGISPDEPYTPAISKYLYSPVVKLWERDLTTTNPDDRRRGFGCDLYLMETRGRGFQRMEEQISTTDPSSVTSVDILEELILPALRRDYGDEEVRGRESDMRRRLTRLAHERPELREHVLPLLTQHLQQLDQEPRGGGGIGGRDDG